MKKSNKMNLFILGFVKLTGYLPAWLFFKPKVYYMNESCKKGLEKPSILMSNHKSLMDFVLYLVLFPFNSIHFLMAEVLFKKSPVFSWFLYKLGAIFVNRDACDFNFVSESLEVLDKGGNVGIFPQGRLPVKGQPFPFKPGIVLVALNSSAPIIPICTDGNYGLFKRTNVMIGEKIYLQDLCQSDINDTEEINRLTLLLEEKMNMMQSELEKRLG